MPSLNHIHTFVRYKKRSGKTLKTWWWRCADSQCTRVVDYEMAIDKKTKCTRCGNVFILDANAMRSINPLCLDCGTSKKAIAHQKGKALIASVFAGLEEEMKNSEDGE